MQPNARNAPHIIQARLTLMELVRERSEPPQFHLPTTAVAIYPRITYGELYALLDKPLPLMIPPFKSVTDIDHLFTANGKMVAPCFSLPAGPVEYGGACPVSNAYFDLPEVGFRMPDGTMESASLDPRSVALHRRMAGPEQGKRWVCNQCYALAGNFGLPSVVLKYVVVQKWIEDRLEDGTLAETLIDGIKFHREYLRRVCMKRFKKTKRTVYTATPKQIEKLSQSKSSHPDYFRLHDTGDFFSPAYFHAWCEVAEAIPDLRIWASTRAWADPFLASAMKSTQVPRNLILRPSELFMDDVPRQLPSPLAAGSMIHSLQSEKAGMAPPAEIYRCPATHKDVSNCQMAAGNYAGRAQRNQEILWPSGCRFCWDAGSKPVVYKEH